jgi:prolyl 4-hydroxylase
MSEARRSTTGALFLHLRFVRVAPTAPVVVHGRTMNIQVNPPAGLDRHWLDWLREQLRIGCDMSDSVARLRSEGFSDEAILEGLEVVRPRGDAISSGFMNPPLLQKPPAKLRKFPSDRLQLYELDDFLSAKECARLIGLINHHLRPSTLSYASDDKAFRTSQTADLCHLKSPVATHIDEKICRTLGIRVQYSEGIQAQRYDVGQQFKPHWDYFEPDTHVYRRLAGLRGNRTWTFMVYLNEGMEGGATRFTEIDYVVKPKAGMAVIWNNLHEDGSTNSATMHCGEPVISGHKLIITKWFRVHGDGPLFYPS